MVYLMKQACGHYELFQTHINSEKEAMEWLDIMAKESEKRKCTLCTCRNLGLKIGEGKGHEIH